MMDAGARSWTVTGSFPSCSWCTTEVQELILEADLRCCAHEKQAGFISITFGQLTFSLDRQPTGRCLELRDSRLGSLLS